MYDELIRSCRACATGYEGNCDNCMFSGEDCYKQLHKASADAIEELSKRLDESIPKGDAEIIISEMASPRWIPVTERLPEQSGTYIVYVYGDVTDLNYWYGKWHRLGDDYTKAVTHWMPFPEPPKEVRNCDS